MWALDSQFDQTKDGRILKLLNVVDEHTREALAITSLLEAWVLVEDWRIADNTLRPTAPSAP